MAATLPPKGPAGADGAVGSDSVPGAGFENAMTSSTIPLRFMAR
jgi:hypothetical protein